MHKNIPRTSERKIMRHKSTCVKRGKSSRYMGVHFGPSKTSPWKAQIRLATLGNEKPKQVYVGSFKTERAAARAYDSYAEKEGYPKNFK